MATKISKKTFSGSSKVFDGTLAAALRGNAQYVAANIVKALSDITDSSTGVSGGATLAAVALPAAFTSAGTDAAPKAGTETALGTVRDALTVLLTSAKAAADAVSIDGVTISTGGTVATPGTIPAVTKSVTAVAGSAGTGIGAVTALPVLSAYRDQLADAAKYVNEVAVAVGLNPVTDNSGGAQGGNRVFEALVTGTGTAATAPQAAALGTLSKAAVDAYLTALANGIATLAAKLNEATSDARVVKPFVVAAA